MQTAGGIFGSPPEPLFNVKPHLMAEHLLEEWLQRMREENDRRLDKSIKLHSQMFYKAGDAAEYVFNMCDKLKQPPDVKYFAVELFNKFMVQHVYDLYEHIKQSGSARRDQDWRATMERVRHQVVLRVITCCQVASKLTSHYKVVTPRRAWRTLQEFGHRYDTENILQSELRVIKTLNYRLVINTPLVYVEAMLELLGRRRQECAVKQYHGTCLKLLNVVYIEREVIYDNLFTVCASENSKHPPPDRETFRRVESDLVLLGASVVAASAFITDQRHTDTVIEEVSDMGKLNSSDVVDFSTVILEVVMQEMEQ